MDVTRDLQSPRFRGERASLEVAQGERVGEWIVEGILGGGGFGTVYEAIHARTSARAALKLLHAHFVTSADMLARFEREVEVLRRMSHPNIVQLVDAGFHHDRPYLCMELVAGEELSKRIERIGSLRADEALAVLEPLCEAVAVAHALNIVHRDIKASNVIVCGPPGGAIDRVVLLDFGIAKLSDTFAAELTASRQSLGTPSCMAPEQIHGLRVDARTDVYALGGLLFHMLTGRLPFQDPSATMTQYLHLHARRPNVSSVVAVSPRLDEVITRAMAIEPAERFADPQALFAAARGALLEPMVTPSAVTETSCVALLVMTGDRTGGGVLDAAFFNDLEGILPMAERFLVEQGFRLVVDLGSSALFVARADRVGTPVAIATALFEHLDRRERRDARVRIGVGVHRDHARYLGQEIQAGPLLQFATWNLPDPIDGVWVSSKIDDTAPTGRRVRG